MARGPSRSGSYRQWEAAQRAQQRATDQAARQKEQELKVRAREHAQREAADRDKDAAARTCAVEQRVLKLEGLLRSSLARDPGISVESLRRRVAVAPLDLGELAVPFPAPQWTDLYRTQYEGSAVCSAVRNGTKLLSMRRGRRSGKPKMTKLSAPRGPATQADRGSTARSQAEGSGVRTRGRCPQRPYR